MTAIQRLRDVRRLLAGLPAGDADAEARALAHDRRLTKPAGALGRLEALAAWAARWQGRHPPVAGPIRVVVFAGNHGVARRNVSAFPAAVTSQMVANFARGGAAINQLAAAIGAALDVRGLDLDQPTADFTEVPAMDEGACVRAFASGLAAVRPGDALLCVGEMGIGNTTAAAALAALLFGGAADDWVGRGTGVDDAGLARKRDAIDAALRLHRSLVADPLEALRRVGGREMAAMAGAVLAARFARIPVILDGFVCGAAAATLFALEPTALDHCLVGHCSAEAGHRRLLERIGKPPLLDLDMRLGEASGAALAAGVVRAAILVHNGMATFDQAGISEREP